jgi:hypothetical protein
MKSAEKPKRYEVIPIRMVLSAIPIPADGALPDSPSEESDACQWPDELPITGVFTRPTCLERARQQAEELLWHCRERLRRGDRSAIPELLDLNPEFISVRWVREELFQLVEGGCPLRKRGRPWGRYKMHPLFVVGLVEHLMVTKRAKNPEQAFGRLEELGVLSYESAKECFYRAQREKRFEPVLMEFPELRQVISDEEAARLLRTAEVLQPGKKSVRRWEDSRLGTVELVIEGR